MYKILTILGTRPEIIKMSRVINIFDKYTDQILVHTGQNYDYELNEIFFKDLNVREPNYFLKANGKSPSETIANTIHKIDLLIKKIKPDAALIYGDTNSCLSVISLKRNKIPIFHMEGGNRCFDQRVPEEINRKIVDHTSDINFVLTEHAKNYLIKEGIKPETIIKTGTHMKEVISYNYDKIIKSNILRKIKIKEKSYFLVSCHREENVDDHYKLKKLILALSKISKLHNKIIIFSTHPRTKKNIKNLNIELPDNILFKKPFSFSEYMKLQINAFCVLSDSGTITEESSLLNFPSVMLREYHERPEGMDKGCTIMSNFDKDKIQFAIKIALDLHSPAQPKIPDDYKDDNVSEKIFKAVISYIDYVNKKVWYK